MSGSSSSAACDPGVVELVQHVGADPARAPLAVVGLGRAGALDRHVVRVDLGGDAIEQDAPLASDGLGADPACEQDRAVSASTIAPRNWLRTCSPRSATSSETREDGLGRGRASAAGTSGPNSVGNIVRQASGSVVSPFMTARARTRSAAVASASSVAARATERIGLDARVDHGAGIAGRVLEPHGRSPSASEHHLREGRQPVDGAVRIRDQADLLDRPVDRGVDGRSARGRRRAAVGDRIQPVAPGGLEVGDVGPLVLDLLAEQRRGRRRHRGRARATVVDGGAGHRATAYGVAVASPGGGRAATRAEVGDATSDATLGAGRDRSDDGPLACGAGRSGRRRARRPRRASRSASRRRARGRPRARSPSGSSSATRSRMAR